MSATIARGSMNWARIPRFMPCSAMAIWRSRSIWPAATSATRASCRWKGKAWHAPAKLFLPVGTGAHAYPRRRASRKRPHVAGALLVQHLPDGEEGREQLHARLDHPEWEHVAALAGTLSEEELTDPALGLESLVWRLFHEESEVRVRAAPP
jgi:hypothetical protein